MDVVLIPGMWLSGSIWDDVAGHLVGRGHRAVALTLPGQGDGNVDATLDDQLNAVVEAVDAAADGVVVAGHSAAASLAWMAADRRPHAVRTVVLIGGFPQADGELYFSPFPPVEGFVPFPGWEPFEGPDAADLDEQQRAAFAAQAISVPATVTHSQVALADARRYEVPVVLVCPEFTPADVQAWMASGELAGELTTISGVEFIDFDSGHWPMISRPAELAQVLADIADRATQFR